MNNTINHIHLEACPSTQLKLKNEFDSLTSKNANILISTQNQTAGIGRRGNHWQSLGNNLAFSFTLGPSATPTLTPLEIAVATVNFMQQNFKINLKVKWPNDILQGDNKKCGGIIINLINNIAIVGIGLNMGHITKPNSLAYPVASILDKKKLSKLDFQEIPLQIYNYILNKRLNEEDIQNKWSQLCAHMDRPVKIIDDNREYIGHFVGIGEKGEAILKLNDQSLQKFYSGSLFIDDCP